MLLTDGFDILNGPIGPGVPAHLVEQVGHLVPLGPQPDHLSRPADCFRNLRATAREKQAGWRDQTTYPQRNFRTTAPTLDQIDADRSTLSGFGVDTNFEADGLITGDLISFTQCRHMKENVNASVIRFYEAEAFFFVPHINFASRHLCPL
jgi:hypothetical protein